MSKSYAEKLRDPRWQRKRLEVLEQRGWQCWSCGSKKHELQVHHPAYRKGAEPWDYDTKELLCLCAGCHHKQTAAGVEMRELALAEPFAHMKMLENFALGQFDEAAWCFIMLCRSYAAKKHIKPVYTMPKTAVNKAVQGMFNECRSGVTNA